MKLGLHLGRMHHHAAARKPKSRFLSIRFRLMLFLCFICLSLLALFWFMSTRFLEPLYNRYITDRLSDEVGSVVSLLDNAIANGEEIVQRSGGELTLTDSFQEQLIGTLESPTNGLNSVCLDIGDSALRNVYCLENLYPCLLHNSSLSGLADSLPSYRNNATVLLLRRLCMSNGGLSRTLDVAGGSQQVVIGKTSADGRYTVLMATSLAHVAEASLVLNILLPAISLLMFLLALLAAWAFSVWFTDPLLQLSEAARQMAEGNYDITVESSGRDELGDLSRDFNHMAQEVKRSSQLQRELLANVSHDLRTPLTLIKGYAETVRDLTGDDKARRDEQLNIIVDETDRLSALVNSVMELSKVSSGTQHCEQVHFDMGQLCEEVSERYDAVCEQNGWHLELALADTALPVYADPAMMERALHNLLGNAMHHIGPDGCFILRAAPCPEGVRVEVEDHGEGIRPEDQPYIFDRYYRSRSDAGKVGTGLGLSITKAIFQQHGFRFGVESTLGSGTTFWFIMNDRENPPDI